MGIKGIYREIGPGRRISLTKLSVQHLETHSRPFRLAIDFSIWQFQVAAARGGANPAIRTLFYRLLRLLGLGIVPVFVFDGPHKPVWKRNKRSGAGGGVAVATAMAKRLIRLFGFVCHDAPGEAEAECALLQREGVVDAVLSEDVDTIMFGCGVTLRNWSAEGNGGAKTPTHVSMYDAAQLAEGENGNGLDREGMVLVALMSGGDYAPEGVPGCGVKVACEAARAGFGRDLCRIKRSDSEAPEKWKARLLHELRTNESGFFKTKHKALEIPDEFPSLEILRYYTHPVVSQPEMVQRLQNEIRSRSEIDVLGLREFVREGFDWNYRGGAFKFVRVLAPALLTQKLLSRGGLDISAPERTPEQSKVAEGKLITGISGTRAHWSTDAVTELRVSHIPADIVGLDLSAEEVEPVATYGRTGLALNSDNEEDPEVEEAELASSSQKAYDPLQPNLAWVPESVAKLGVPLTVEDWEEQQRAKVAAKAAKTTRIRSKAKSDMPTGALYRWITPSARTGPTLVENIPLPSSLAGLRLMSTQAAPTAKPGLRSTAPQIGAAADTSSSRSVVGRKGTQSKQSKPNTANGRAAGVRPEPARPTDPWALASSQTSSTRITKSSTAVELEKSRTAATAEVITISSSPAAPSSPPTCPPLRAGPPQTLSRATPSRIPEPGSKRASKDVRLAATGSPSKSTRRCPERTESTTSIVSRGSPQRSTTARVQLPITNYGFAMQKGHQRSEKGSEGTINKVFVMPDPFHITTDAPLIEDQAQDRELASTTVQRSAPIPADVFDNTAAASTRTKLYMPRTSEVGYFRTVEVTKDEADKVMAAEKRKHGKTGGADGVRAAILRRSDLPFIDLTDAD